MNLTDSLLGAICLVFLLVLLGTLTQERAASLELGRSAELMDDLASAAEACARDHESELSLTTGPEGNPSVLREAGYLRPSFPDSLADGRPLRFFLRRLTADSAPLILAVAEGTPASWKGNAGSERRFASLYALPLAKKLPGGGYVSTTGSGRDETTLQGARSSFTLSLKSLGISLPPGTTALLRLADTDGTEPGTADSSAFLHRKAEGGLNTILSDLGFSAHSLRDTGAAVFASSSQGADTAAADGFAALCQAGDTGSGSPEGLTRYIPGAGLAVCRNGRAALLGRDSAFLSAAGVFFAGPSDGVITNLATPLRTFSRPVLKPACPEGTRAAIFAVPAPGFREKEVSVEDAGDPWLVTVKGSLLQGTEKTDSRSAAESFSASEEIPEPAPSGSLQLGTGTSSGEDVPQDTYFYMADSSALVMTGCFPTP